MAHYNPHSRDTSMERWRKFAVYTMDRFPPSFLMVLFLLALAFGMDAHGQIPAVDWIAERFGIIPAIWKILFAFGAVTIAYFRPAPKYTLLLSLPAAVLGGGILWYGIVSQHDIAAMIYIFFAWLSIGVAMVAMVLYQEQLMANEVLANEITTMKAKEQASVAKPIEPAQT